MLDNINYFGVNVPSSLTSIVTISESGDVILPSTEFKFTDNLIGLNFYMANAGKVEFYVIINTF